MLVDGTSSELSPGDQPADPGSTAAPTPPSEGADVNPTEDSPPSPGQETPETQNTNTPDDTPSPPDVEPDQVVISVVDSDPTEEDLSLEQGSECETVLQALNTNDTNPDAYNPEFQQLIRAVRDITTTEVYDLFKEKEASITLFLPPREKAKGLLGSLQKGTISVGEVRHSTPNCAYQRSSSSTGAQKVLCVTLLNYMVHVSLVCKRAIVGSVIGVLSDW